MSRKTVVLFTVILVVVLVSCSENPGTTSMKLILSTYSESTGKTLLPSDSSLLDVSKYSVSGTGPNGKTFSVDSDSSSLTIEGLVVGDWTVTAKGINSVGTELVTGSLSFKLTDNPIPQTIVLETLVGTGEFKFTVDWSLCSVSNPEVEAFLLGPDMSGTEYELEDITVSGKTATISGSLAAGSYRLRVLLNEGATQIAGLVEALRISNGTMTEGSHTFHVNEIGANTVTYITDATGTPIKGSVAIEGSPAKMLSDTSYKCVFTFEDPSTVSVDGLTIEWYYDGNFMSSSALDATGSSLTFSPTKGVHRIDAIVYNKKMGSTGSANCSFTVEPNGESGDLTLAVEDAATGMEITAKTVVGALPDDKFIVLTPDANRLYICSINANSITIQKTYTNNELNWIADVNKMFSDYQSNYVLFSGKFIDGKESVLCMHFDSSANTLAEKLRRYYTLLDKPTYSFSNISAAAFAGDTGIIIGDAGSKKDLALSINNYEVAIAGNNVKKDESHYAVSDMDVSTDGVSVVSTCQSATTFVSAIIGSGGTLIEPQFSEANTSAGKFIRYVNTQLVIVANDSSYTSYKVVYNGVYTKYKAFSAPVKGLEADGLNYFYILDSANRILAFEASSYEVQQQGSVQLPSAAQSFALTSDHFIVLMENLKLNVYDII